MIEVILDEDTEYWLALQEALLSTYFEAIYSEDGKCSECGSSDVEESEVLVME
jgi:hypothetical protein